MTGLAYAPSAGTSIERLGAPIWERLFLMRVRYIDTIPSETLKEIGVLDSGNRQLNRQMHNDLVTVMIKINDMVEYFKRGVTVTFVNHAETRDAYEIVNNYLMAWKHQIDQGLNLGKVPMDDLFLLDRWAQALYPVALKFGTQPRTGTSLFASLLAGQRDLITRDSLFGPKTEGPQGPTEPTQHASHTPDLTKSLARLRGGWTNFPGS